MNHFARIVLAVSCVCRFCGNAACAQVPHNHKTQNIIFVMTDGLRWQEVFGGTDEVLMNKKNGKVKDEAALKKEYWRDTPEARREVLLPFVWDVMAKQGQVFGNRNKGSEAYVTNGKNYSYPGYSETLCGFADPDAPASHNCQRNYETAGSLRFLGITPVHRYFEPFRHLLAFLPFPGSAGYRSDLLQSISLWDEEGFSSA